MLAVDDQEFPLGLAEVSDRLVLAERLELELLVGEEEDGPGDERLSRGCLEEIDDGGHFAAVECPLEAALAAFDAGDEGGDFVPSRRRLRGDLFPLMVVAADESRFGQQVGSLVAYEIERPFLLADSRCKHSSSAAQSACIRNAPEWSRKYRTRSMVSSRIHAMLVDSHAHLDDPAFEVDRLDVLDRARRNGVGRILTVGTDHASCERACALASEHEDVFAALGYHPHEGDRYAQDDLSALKALAAHPKVLAIGETGLDYAKNFSSIDGQKTLFRKHLALARELGKPVVIHCRDAHAHTRQILREEGISRGVIHCFSGNAEDAREYVAMGFFLSIAGPVTFSNADKLRAVVKAIPLDRLLVETDCPLLTPAPHRGKRNEPAYVMYTAAAVAGAHGLRPEEIAEATTRNARALFGF